MKYAIFDLNGRVAFFDEADDKEDAICRLAMEDESYTEIDESRVHALDEEECLLLETWVIQGQKTNEWPFDWHTSV